MTKLDVRTAVLSDLGDIGAATVSAPSPFRLFDADAATVTESSALPGFAHDTVLAVVSWCLRTECPTVGLQMAGAHDAFVPLLELGFTITDIDTTCGSDEGLLADPSLTTFYGEPLPPYSGLA